MKFKTLEGDHTEVPEDKEEILLGAQRLLVGTFAVICEATLQINEQYMDMYNIGYTEHSIRSLISYCQRKDEFKIRLIFINEPPFRIHNLVYFCLKEVGRGCGRNGDWHWFTLDQLIICEKI